MAFRFDHAVIAVHDLDQAVLDYQTLGFTTIYGGEHATGTTHNALIAFQDGTYLELLAPTNKPARPGVEATDFRRALEHGEGLIGYALLSDNLVEDVAAMRRRGVMIGDTVQGGRLRKDGVELRWESAMIGTSMSPFFIRDVTPRNLRVADDEKTTHHSNSVTGLREVIFVVSDLDGASQRYQMLLGVPAERSGENEVSFTLDQTRLKLILPADENARQHITVRGDAPYSLTFASNEPVLIDADRSHGVRFAGV